MKSAFIFLAEGFEEIEAITPVDILRRAGVDIKTVSITGNRIVTGTKGVPVKADLLLEEADLRGASCLIVPGGLPGATNLAACRPLCDLLIEHHAQGGRIAAICAAPAVVLAPLGILDGIEATCYPGCEGGFSPATTYIADKRVVVTPLVITANGPSSALLFALAIAKELAGKAVADEVAAGVLLK